MSVKNSKKNISENGTEEKTKKVSKENGIKENKYEKYKNISNLFRIEFEIDLVSILLLLFGLVTRMYKLEQPRNIVFDELHYGKYVALYMKNTFFFDSHPPLGKQLIAIMAYLANFDGSFKFDRIGSPYSDNVPLLALRLVPAFFGSILIPTSYHLLLELGLSQWASILGAFLILFDNALLTQSRFILMESILIFFSLYGILCIVKYLKCKPYSLLWFFWLISGSFTLTCAILVKYIGFYSFLLSITLILKHNWKLLGNNQLSDWFLFVRFVIENILFWFIAIIVYILIFFIHLEILYKAGPHDSIMTSAFQASLDGGLASITKGQPLIVAHGSQITLRHTHGRTCWLHSHNHLYPIKYLDNRGSSHQQQISCYSFKDVNNWWIIKRPNKTDLVVEQPIDIIKHGDIIQLVHGITSRALNSHDVAAPMSPNLQEVSGYIDYNVSMPPQNLWKVDILNRNEYGNQWHTIHSLVRLIHLNTNAALKYSGKQLPDWGFHQHEIVADTIINQDDTVWNVEEHRYTKNEDQKERERELITAEMIPTSSTKLSFWEKFFELQYKMLFNSANGIQNHMYSSIPIEWPFMNRGIAYWVASNSNAQIHLLGNLLIWYSGTIGLFIYFSLFLYHLLRRHRNCDNLNDIMWEKFLLIGHVLFIGYLLHFIPFFFVDRTLFLHHYLMAFTFKTLLLAAIIDHIFNVISHDSIFVYIFITFLLGWFFMVFYVFKKFLVLCYGTTNLTANDILNLRWKDTWDFIIHRTN